jgi:hypothetical protein
MYVTKQCSKMCAIIIIICSVLPLNLFCLDIDKFGDVSRWLDSRAKAAVADRTGKDYEFGDLSRYLDERAKQSVNEFTKSDEYVMLEWSNVDCIELNFKS